MASSSWQRLRRLAPRVLRVIERRQAGSPVIRAYASTLGAKVNAYVAAYDQAMRYRGNWQKEMAEGRGAVGHLVKVLRGWLPLLQRDVPGFDSSAYADHPNVPDDVIEDGSRLHDVIMDFVHADGSALAYKEDCLSQLDSALAAALKEWGEADAADKAYQDVLARVRATGDELDRELQGFRRTLLNEVGRRDKDYQKLRAERAHVADADDDPNGPPASSPVSPAPAGTNQPAA